MLPDFIVIGPAKAGSRWIYECLREHPSVCLAKNVKGTRFFEKYYFKGIGWYESFFEACNPGLVKGEVDETYISCPEAPARIHQHIPYVKLVTCLRNPMERTFSAYLYFHRMGIINEPFETALDHFRKILISDTLYYEHLKNYLKYFSAENILIVLFDDLSENPSQFIKNIYKFIGLDPDFCPSVINQKINVARAPRSRVINKLAIKTSLLLRRWDLLWPYYKARNSKILQKILFSKEFRNGPPLMSMAARTRLQEEYAYQIKMLADLIGRDLTHWK